MSNTDISNLIKGGDWNITLQSVVKRSGVPCKSSAHQKKLFFVNDGRIKLELIDIFRKQYPDLSFSYESQTLKVCSRMYFFLVARSFSKCVVNIHSKASNATAQKAMERSLELSEERRGPLMWKFNNAFVDDEKYVNHIIENNPIIGEKYREFHDHRLKWELMQQDGNKRPYNCLLVKQSQKTTQRRIGCTNRLRGTRKPNFWQHQSRIYQQAHSQTTTVLLFNFMRKNRTANVTLHNRMNGKG